MYVIHNIYFHNSEFMHSNYRVPSYRQTILRQTSHIFPSNTSRTRKELSVIRPCHVNPVPQGSGSTAGERAQ
jgi:hypothetical protein